MARLSLKELLARSEERPRAPISTEKWNKVIEQVEKYRESQEFKKYRDELTDPTKSIFFADSHTQKSPYDNDRPIVALPPNKERDTPSTESPVVGSW